MMIIGYQGQAGSFSEQALDEYFGAADRQNFLGFADVFQAVRNGKVQLGIVPVENSSTGGIPEIYDLLCTYDLAIVGEKIMHIEQNLLVLPEAEVEDITEVYSHPQGFRQSEEFLKAYPDWKLIPYHNTAVSAAYIRAQGDKKMAAIAGKKAAQIYGLKILRPGINSYQGNYTRFLNLGQAGAVERDADKISLIFSLPHQPGALHHILGFFAKAHLNLLKIESRPIIGRPWEYYFFVDFRGSLLEKEVQEAVDQVKKDCSFFKLLGNYRGDWSRV